MTNNHDEETTSKQQVYTYVVEVDLNPDDPKLYGPLGKTYDPKLYGPLSYEAAEALEHERRIARREDEYSRVWIWLHPSYSSDPKYVFGEVCHRLETMPIFDAMEESQYAKILARGTTKFYLHHHFSKSGDMVTLTCGPFDTANEAQAVRKRAKSKRRWYVHVTAEDTLEEYIKSQQESTRRLAELGIKGARKAVGVSQDFVLHTDMKKWDKETEKQWKAEQTNGNRLADAFHSQRKTTKLKRRRTKNDSR